MDNYHKECPICLGHNTIKIEKEIYHSKGKYPKEYTTTQYKKCWYCKGGMVSTRKYNIIKRWVAI